VGGYVVDDAKDEGLILDERLKVVEDEV